MHSSLEDYMNLLQQDQEVPPLNWAQTLSVTATSSHVAF